MFIDSHCHLNPPYFEEDDLPNVLKRATENDVGLLLAICTQMSDFPAILKIVEDNEQVFGAFGIHPDTANKKVILSAEEIIKHCKMHPKIVTIGETGLDYYHTGFDKQAQQESFKNHVQAAAALDLPVVIHARNADDDMCEFLQTEMKNAPFRGVLHCFTASEKLARVGLNLGLYISFSGILTFKSAKTLHEIAKNFVPLDRILVETDAPFLAPVPYRGKLNEPAFVTHVAKFLAKLRNMKIEELNQQIEQNFRTLFDKIRL